jgi:hypothetical protein
MILESLSVFLLAWAAGFGVAHAAWKSTSPWSFVLKASLGIGLGLGLTSCLYFLRLILFPGQDGYLLIQAGQILAILGFLFFQRRLSFLVSLKSLPVSRVQILLGVAAVLVLVLALRYSLVTARLSPHGDYDAHAIWNLRARFIYRLGNEWQQAFSPNINRDFHMDYPLLIPMNVTGGWNTLNSEVLRVPAVQAVLFLVGLAGVLFSTLAYLRSVSQGSLAMIVLLATPYILQFSMFQTADIPLGFFFLAATALLFIAKQETSAGLLFLCGLASGLSAWTKNEGVSFASITAVSVLVLFYKQGWRRYYSFFGGMALPVLTLFVFRAVLPGRNDLLVDNSLLQIIQKITDPDRYSTILQYLGTETAGLGGWPFSILLLLIVYGLIIGANRSLGNGLVLWFLWVVAAQFLAYFAIYLITPNDQEWQIMYSMSRLLIHLFPMALLAFFLFVRTPEEALESSGALENTASSQSIEENP